MKERKRMTADAKKESASLSLPSELLKEFIQASMKGNVAKVKRLLKNKKKKFFDINESMEIRHLTQLQPTSDHTNALLAACGQNCLGVLDRLLKEKDIDINCQLNDVGETALFRACQHAHLSIVNRLLEEKETIDINLPNHFMRDDNGNPAFRGTAVLYSCIAFYCINYLHIIYFFVQGSIR